MDASTLGRSTPSEYAVIPISVRPAAPASAHREHHVPGMGIDAASPHPTHWIRGLPSFIPTAKSGFGMRRLSVTAGVRYRQRALQYDGVGYIPSSRSDGKR